MPSKTDPSNRNVASSGRSQYEHDTDHGSDERTRQRARENADGTLARLWKRMKRALGPD